jgi:signal transduction histidine kinase
VQGDLRERAELVVKADPRERERMGSLLKQAGSTLPVHREALSNVGRHAQAATCRVSLYRSDDRLMFEIDDDGQGFDPETIRRGDGLTNLEARARALGGTFSVESTRGKGTTITAALSL